MNFPNYPKAGTKYRLNCVSDKDEACGFHKGDIVLALENSTVPCCEPITFHKKTFWNKWITPLKYRYRAFTSNQLDEIEESCT